MGQNHQHLVDQHTTQTQVEEKSREVNTHTHDNNNNNNNNNNTSSKQTQTYDEVYWIDCILFLLWLQQLLHCRLKSYLPAFSRHNLVTLYGLMENWCTSLSAIRIHQSHSAELSLWSAKLVPPVSPRRNSADGSLTHLSALRSLITNHLILMTATPQSGTPKSCMVRWVQGSAAGTESGRRSPSARRTHQLLILITATPQSGTPKSCMVRWVPRSAAGTESGSASLSAMVVTRMIKLFCFCDYIPLAQAQVQWKKKAHVNFVRCKITM